jgi:hypothetical protein
MGLFALVVVLVVLGVFWSVQSGSFYVEDVDTTTVTEKKSLRNVETSVRHQNGTLDEVVVRFSAPGGYPVDLRELTVQWIGPAGNDTLTAGADFDSPENLSGSTFAYRVVTDENESAPTMDYVTDRFGIVVRPNTFADVGRFESGDRVTLRIEVPGLANTTIEVRISANESDVSG